MRVAERIFEQVASSISEMRGTVQSDVDRCYSVNGSIVLDQLTQRLADAFAAHYPCFEREAFLGATHVPQRSSQPTDSACDDPGIRSRVGCRVDTNTCGEPPEAEDPISLHLLRGRVGDND